MSRKDEEKDILAIIPARGGSKSVPRKNVLPINGKPLLAWTIEHAKSSSLINRVIVSTDDEEIAEVALSFGAEVPFMRPKELADDDSLDIEYHHHALEWLSENENYIPKFVVNLRPSTPTRLPETIDNAIKLFSSHPEADALRSVRIAEQSPFKMWLIDEQGFLKVIAHVDGIDEPYNMPRQRLPLVYWQDGYVDVTRPATIMDQKSTTGKVILPFIITEDTADIDYPDDIKVALEKLEVFGSANREESKRHPS